MNQALNYFRLKYYLGMSKEEVDNTEGTLIDTYMVALSEMNKKGGTGGQRENDELQKAFMG